MARRFLIPPSTATLWRRTAVGIWGITPMFGFPLLLPILDPAIIPEVLAELWPAYLLFFGLPFGVGAICWTLAKRADGAAKQN